MHKVSKDNEVDILPIRQKLQEAIAELPNVGLVLPKKWAAVKKVLTEEAHHHAHISLERFFELCRGNGVQDQKSALLISRYFHEIGSLIHYSDDEMSPLYKLVILNRKWATEAIYQVILDKDIRIAGGRFTKKDVQRIWDDSTYKGMMSELMALLRKFEICYILPNSNPETFLIPQCLPDQYPEGIDEHLENPLSIRYKYDFLPYGIINRLTVRLHENIQDKKVWKQGMVLENKEGRALVEEVKNINQGFIRITLSGDQEDRWWLQNKIKEQLDALNTTYNLQESVTVQVPCTCEKCKEKKEPHSHDYQRLVEMLKEKIEVVRCGEKPFKEIKILELIDHAFFTRPKEVEQSLKSGLDFRGAHIDKVVLGDSHDKEQRIKAEGDATVQIAESGGQNESSASDESSSTLRVCLKI